MHDNLFSFCTGYIRDDQRLQWEDRKSGSNHMLSLGHICHYYSSVDSLYFSEIYVMDQEINIEFLIEISVLFYSHVESSLRVHLK